jgi:hypothetical protein
MMPVKPQISKFEDEKSCVKRALVCYGGTPHEHLLSESRRSYMLVFRTYAISFWSQSPKDYLEEI